MLAAPRGVRQLAQVFARTFCPQFKFSSSEGGAISARHETAKKKGYEAVKGRVVGEGWIIDGSAGIKNSEAKVTVTLHRLTYHGKADIVLLASKEEERGKEYLVIVAEAKSSMASMASLSTLLQGALYIAPLYGCRRYPSKCSVAVRKEGEVYTFEVRSPTGILTAQLVPEERALQVDVINPAKIGYRLYLVSLRGNREEVREVTSDANIIIDAIYDFGVPQLSISNLVPGPWCNYCELLLNGKCSAGLKA